jgi:hypothetical protein
MATARADNEIQEVEADLQEIQPASIELDYSHYFDVDGRTKRKGLNYNTQFLNYILTIASLCETLLRCVYYFLVPL